MTEQVTENALALVDFDEHYVRQVEDLVRQTYAKSITKDEFRLFLIEAKALGLDPIKREYVPLSFGSEKQVVNGREQWVPTYRGYITVHGVRALAAKTGLLDGTDGPYWCGADGDFKPVWLDDDNNPKAARFTVWRKDASRPFHGVVTMKRAATYKDKTGKVQLTPKWRDDPMTMLAIRAETDAYKRAGLMAEHPAFNRGTAVEDGAGFVIDGEAESRLAEGRRIHAIGTGRGIDHNGIRTAVQQMDPELETLGEAHPQDLASTADQFIVYDADGIGRLTGMDPTEVEGEPDPGTPAEPDEVRSDDEVATDEQMQWIKRNEFKVDPEKMPPDTFEWLTNLETTNLTFKMAERLMRDMARSRPKKPEAPTGK